MVVSDGEVLLLRTAAGTGYAAVQPGRQTAAGIVQYRIWILSSPEAPVKPVRAGRAQSARVGRGGSVRIPVASLDGVLEWWPGRDGEGRFRAAGGSLLLCPTREQDPRRPRPGRCPLALPLARPGPGPRSAAGESSPAGSPWRRAPPAERGGESSGGSRLPGLKQRSPGSAGHRG